MLNNEDNNETRNDTESGEQRSEFTKDNESASGTENENRSENQQNNENQNVNVNQNNTNEEQNEAPQTTDNSGDGSYSYKRDSITENRTDVNENRNPYMNNTSSQNDRGYSSYERNSTGSYNSSYTGSHNPNEQQQRPQSNYGISRTESEGQISYAPNKSSEKKTKKSKSGSMSRAGIAVLCAAMICVSAGAGFLGAYAANKAAGGTSSASASDSDTVSTTVGTISNSSGSDSDDTTVIYRAVQTDDNSNSALTSSLTYSQVASMVADSVVEITTDFNVQSMWYNYVSEGAGSGVVISTDGYIITNNHVVYSDDTGDYADSITVRLHNGDEYTATLVGADEDSDIAVVKIDASDLTAAVVGTSSNLVVGQEVLAVGNPLGELGGTVTKGIISATERTITVNDVEMNLIQTDAAINPGNSGGGLFNMNGELIGIVNAKSSGSGIEGLGFAIPVDDAINVAQQLMEYGFVRGQSFIGVSFYNFSNQQTAMYYGFRNAGIYVYELTEGYNDDVLQVGDRVVAVNGTEVTALSDISSIVSSSAIGDKLTFQIYRDGKLTEVEVTVYEKVPEGYNAVDFGSET